MSISRDNNIKSFIEKEVKNSTKKVKGKKIAIAEIIDNALISLPVKSIYDMNEKIKGCYFFIVKNHAKQPKLRYFLTISLANNSSDLLVQLAKEFARKNELQLIQYSIYPKTVRTQLLSMKEIKIIEDYNDSIEVLKRFRKEFREKLMVLKNLVENK
ncbi:MAG: hypothetical protein KGD58_00645 [Candidatus Lokiarchaeota archaeon]|nr:hypothetical protein [Candidatus Lokiarchaeota archaeon]